MSIECEVNVVKIQTALAHVGKNPEVMLAIHNTMAKEVNPYVPMQTGTLSQSTEITAKGVTYTMPYAHYQYTGIVYGPNFPIVKDGVIEGWYSPPGKGSKHPTGAPITYSTELHPLATHHWEKTMMRNKGKEYTKQVKKILLHFLLRKG